MEGVASPHSVPSDRELLQMEKLKEAMAKKRQKELDERLREQAMAKKKQREQEESETATEEDALPGETKADRRRRLDRERKRSQRATKNGEGHEYRPLRGDEDDEGGEEDFLRKRIKLEPEEEQEFEEELEEFPDPFQPNYQLDRSQEDQDSQDSQDEFQIRPDDPDDPEDPEDQEQEEEQEQNSGEDDGDVYNSQEEEESQEEDGEFSEGDNSNDYDDIELGPVPDETDESEGEEFEIKPVRRSTRAKRKPSKKGKRGKKGKKNNRSANSTPPIQFTIKDGESAHDFKKRVERERKRIKRMEDDNRVYDGDDPEAVPGETWGDYRRRKERERVKAKRAQRKSLNPEPVSAENIQVDERDVRHRAVRSIRNQIDAMLRTEFEKKVNYAINNYTKKKKRAKQPKDGSNTSTTAPVPLVGEEEPGPDEAEELIWKELLLQQLYLEYEVQRNILVNEAIELELGTNKEQEGENGTPPGPNPPPTSSSNSNEHNNENGNGTGPTLRNRNPSLEHGGYFDTNEVKVELEEVPEWDDNEGANVQDWIARAIQDDEEGEDPEDREYRDQDDDSQEFVETERMRRNRNVRQMKKKLQTLEEQFKAARQSWEERRPYDTARRAQLDAARAATSAVAREEKSQLLSRACELLLQKRIEYSTETKEEREQRISQVLQQHKENYLQNKIKAITPKIPGQTPPKRPVTKNKPRIAAYAKERFHMEKREYDLYIQLTAAENANDFKGILSIPENRETVQYWGEVARSSRAKMSQEMKAYRKNMEKFLHTGTTVVWNEATQAPQIQGSAAQNFHEFQKFDSIHGQKVKGHLEFRRFYMTRRCVKYKELRVELQFVKALQSKRSKLKKKYGDDIPPEKMAEVDAWERGGATNWIAKREQRQWKRQQKEMKNIMGGPRRQRKPKLDMNGIPIPPKPRKPRSSSAPKQSTPMAMTMSSSTPTSAAKQPTSSSSSAPARQSSNAAASAFNMSIHQFQQSLQNQHHPPSSSSSTLPERYPYGHGGHLPLSSAYSHSQSSQYQSQNQSQQHHHQETYGGSDYHDDSIGGHDQDDDCSSEAWTPAGSIENVNVGVPHSSSFQQYLDLDRLQQHQLQQQQQQYIHQQIQQQQPQQQFPLNFNMGESSLAFQMSQFHHQSSTQAATGAAGISSDWGHHPHIPSSSTSSPYQNQHVQQHYSSLGLGLGLPNVPSSSSTATGQSQKAKRPPGTKGRPKGSRNQSKACKLVNQSVKRQRKRRPKGEGDDIWGNRERKEKRMARKEAGIVKLTHLQQAEQLMPPETLSPFQRSLCTLFEEKLEQNVSNLCSKCTACNKVFLDDAGYQTHMRKEHPDKSKSPGDKSKTPKIGGKRRGRPRKDASTRKRTENPFRCPLDSICSFKPRGVLHLTTHLFKNHYLNQIKLFRCPHALRQGKEVLLGCNNQQYERSQLIIHLRKKHIMDTKQWVLNVEPRSDIKGSVQFLCPNCDFDSDTFDGVIDHFKIQHALYRYHCRHCGIFLREEDHLIDHTSLFHPEVEKDEQVAPPVYIASLDVFRCMACSSEFSSNVFLNAHRELGHNFCKRGDGEQSLSDDDDEENLPVNYIMEPYKCEFCIKSFLGLIELRKHCLGHHNMAKYLQLVKEKGLTEPKQPHHQAQPESEQEASKAPEVQQPKKPPPPSVPQPLPQCCKLCDFSAATIHEVHMVYDNIMGRYCHRCSRPFSRPNMLTKHLEAVHEIPPSLYTPPLPVGTVEAIPDPSATGQSIHCPTCKKYFTLQEFHHYHAFYDMGKWACKQCPATFYTENMLKRHQTVEHNPRQKELTPEGVNLLIEPTLVKQGTGNEMTVFTCKVCFKNFQTKEFCSAHIYSRHEKDAFTRIMCTQCNATVVSLPALKRHQLDAHSELGTLRQKCPSCPKTFTKNTQLKVHHRQFHPGIEIDESAIQTVNIKEYYKERFICNICSRDFATKDGLKSHVTGKHFPIHFTCFCEICGLQTSEKARRSHMKKYHPSANDGPQEPQKKKSKQGRQPYLTVFKLMEAVQDLYKERERTVTKAGTHRYNPRDSYVKRGRKRKATTANSKKWTPRRASKRNKFSDTEDEPSSSSDSDLDEMEDYEVDDNEDDDISNSATEKEDDDNEENEEVSHFEMFSSDEDEEPQYHYIDQSGSDYEGEEGNNSNSGGEGEEGSSGNPFGGMSIRDLVIMPENIKTEPIDPDENEPGPSHDASQCD